MILQSSLNCDEHKHNM